MCETEKLQGRGIPWSTPQVFTPASTTASPSLALTTVVSIIRIDTLEFTAKKRNAPKK